ncbi:hypothetical protein H5T57_06620 [Candidatus Bipolaricaulota bacterium]|nr:hypothetical protein [Candidatus Bipolaricaulota bacterium]
MGPFHLFLLALLLGALVVVGYITVTDCAQAELVELPGTVVGKTTGTVEREQTVVVGGCPACPGSKPETRVVKVSEEVYYLVVEIAEAGETRTQRFMVSEEVYRQTEPETPVVVRYLRGKTRGLMCTPPELIFELGE